MRQIVPLFVLLLCACGDNLTVGEEDSDPLRWICDQGPECDDVVDASLETWLGSGERAGGYIYSSRFAAESGYAIETRVTVAAGAPIARTAAGVRLDEASGELVAFSWEESGPSLGIHSEGARPVPIATLYEDCILDVLTADRVANELVVEIFASGALKSCTQRARGCAGDCTYGPTIDSILAAAE